MTALECVLLIACGFLLACNLIALCVAKHQHKMADELCDAVKDLTKVSQP